MDRPKPNNEEYHYSTDVQMKFAILAVFDHLKFPNDMLPNQVGRAFLYFVWDYFTGSILFMGRVTRPLVL